ncbi:PEP-CTERM sorting domain-containing protein [Roseateles cavernae]|uniref:PEP-CTERM sorting domain-containing protein n=1 Tax=Roseateles cavernae TaxID=3153578 RepID=UPI0032E477A8
MRLIQTASALAALLLLSASALAAPVVSLGQLSRADGSTLITDSLNQRDWLGWDISRGRTLAELAVLTAAGGVFAGYSIATSDDAALFMRAAGAASCPDIPVYADFRDCLVSPALKGLAALVGAMDYGDGGSPDFAHGVVAYMNERLPQRAGMLIAKDHFGRIETWSHLLSSDNFASHADVDELTASGIGVGWLLYREQAGTVPEPASLGLVGLALAALAWSRRSPQRRRLMPA